MSDYFSMYRKVGLQPMRPYTPGESLHGVSIPEGVVPQEGGMIAVNSENPNDRWYVTPEFFEANYELVTPALKEE